jgi:GH24 family phage-related lysozyme (muramidase)
MKSTQLLFTAILLTAAAVAAGGQGLPEPAAQGPAAVPAPASTTAPDDSRAPAIPVPSTIPGTAARAASEIGTLPDAVQTLLSFNPADVKFDVNELMGILSDRRHEGWVLAAYPDPKTAQPLIGAGFSLDLPARVHLQRDPLNPHAFLEPSSADLWQAAGLDPVKLKGILDQFYARKEAWSKRTFRRQIFTLDSQITEDDANALLRIGIVQAIDNAKAYCRNFDQLTASQQMAMTQLVYQMGVNLEEFSSFLTLINRDDARALDAVSRADTHFWRDVQLSLVQSQWARLYRARATAVIAMLDPQYTVDPGGAEHSIAAILHPARHRGRASLRTASYTRHRGTAAHRRARRTRKD